MIQSKKFWKFIYTIISLIGIGMLVYGIVLYELTLINEYLLLLGIIIFSIPLYFFIRNHYANLYDVSKYFYPFCVSITSAGFISVTIFLMLNFHFANKDIINDYDLIIREKGILGGRGRTPYAVVNIENKRKNILFPKGEIIRLNNRVYLKTIKGLFGFEVIVEKKIK
ncbi:hypothetical protein H3Z83_02125 [Tenacibaculum sp. S7007]|uniref:Uncharacterized protein n=1 Tax=Tenacibaculum pelagium TaxID=2759527 RepID=A0A839AJU2_9FLAO|nr:hypothetical protein [Tenacibaculum pelagium]MBA6155325.1 hypothetical protein [Tenacibaculum pelagium]